MRHGARAPSGGVLSKEQYLGGIGAGQLDYLFWEPDSITVGIYGDVAVIRYQSQLEIVVKGATSHASAIGTPISRSGARGSGRSSGPRRRGFSDEQAERTQCRRHEVGMIAFEISIDGQMICTAGVSDVGVASVIASWVRRPARDCTSGSPIPDQFEEELGLDVGGLMQDPDGAPVHIRWLQQPLRLGEQITLTIVEAGEVDPPRTRDREDPADAERRKRRY